MRISTKTTRMLRFVRNLSVPSQKVFVSTKITAAAAYLAQVKSEKLLADMKGYDSVFDYLLAEQEVDRAMFDRQIDLIMKDFAPVAQRYLKHVAKVNGLEKMTFADWKLDLDSALNPQVTIDDAYDLVMKSVEPLGKEYCQEVARYQEERWVDFAANSGKDSGGYAADPISRCTLMSS